MKILDRLRLWVGILLTLALMFALTLLFNHRQHTVASVSAVVDAPTSVIASAFGGVVTEQHVKEGQQVRKGDKLFVVNSSTLQQDVARGARPQSTVAYDLDLKQGTVTYKAVSDGYVTKVTTAAGGYVNDGAPLATVVGSGQRTVVATYRLAPVDYGRIIPGGPVRVFLPNNTKIDGTISDVVVTVEDGVAVTQVTITAPGLDPAQLGILANRGTPVDAVMQLRDDGPLAGVTQGLLSFLTKIGLR